MQPVDVLEKLRLVQKKYKDKPTFTGEVCISDMARDAANAMEELMGITDKWIPVTMMLPNSGIFDWVLVKVLILNDKPFYGVPHIAELRSGKWHFMDYEYGPAEELLGVRVTHWRPIPGDTSDPTSLFDDYEATTPNMVRECFGLPPIRDIDIDNIRRKE